MEYFEQNKSTSKSSAENPQNYTNTSENNSDGRGFFSTATITPFDLVVVEPSETEILATISRKRTNYDMQQPRSIRALVRDPSLRLSERIAFCAILLSCLIKASIKPMLMKIAGRLMMRRDTAISNRASISWRSGDKSTCGLERRETYFRGIFFKDIRKQFKHQSWATLVFLTFLSKLVDFIFEKAGGSLVRLLVSFIWQFSQIGRLIDHEQDASSDRDCCLDQKEDSSVIGRDFLGCCLF